MSYFIKVHFDNMQFDEFRIRHLHHVDTEIHIVVRHVISHKRHETNCSGERKNNDTRVVLTFKITYAVIHIVQK